MRFAPTVILFFTLTVTLGQTTKKALEISHLTGDFYVFTSYNSFKGQIFPANGMYIITDDGAIMIDAPWDSTQYQPLLDSIEIKHGKKVTMCIATHSHDDRTGALEFLRQKGIKTYTTGLTDEISKKTGQKRAEFLIEKDTVFKVGQYSFQTLYAGPGHTSDNIVVWFDKEKILFGGCLIKSVEADALGNVADANLKEWPKTIKNIQRKFHNPNYVVPGHEGWADKGSLNHTLKLLKEYRRENSH